MADFLLFLRESTSTIVAGASCDAPLSCRFFFFDEMPAVSFTTAAPTTGRLAPGAFVFLANNCKPAPTAPSGLKDCEELEARTSGSTASLPASGTDLLLVTFSFLSRFFFNTACMPAEGRNSG